MSAARIPWPYAFRGRPFLIVTKELARAVRNESNQAVAYWFGVQQQTVTKWRRALGVELATEGTRKLRAKWWTEGGVEEASRPARLTAEWSEERREKIAANKRGKKRPLHVVEAVRQAHLGMRHTEEARQKMRETAAHRRCH